jgi:hypothetical protein
VTVVFTPRRRALGAHALFAPALALLFLASSLRPQSAGRTAELWIEPEPNRDLLYGVGGSELAPDPSTTFAIIGIKKGGYSPGYAVRDSNGREWSVKLYPEARTEVVASRILWAVGYHQPPVYTLEEWRATGARAPNPQPVARFREKSPALNALNESGTWSYSDNPFVGTRPLAGLLVLQVMLGNSDLKPDNNMRYTLAQPLEGATHWYVARDLGQAFGRTGVVDAPRDDLEAFDATPFITGVEDGIVKFDYRGLHRNLLNNITRADVHWICGRLATLTDQQWSDAFRAGGYADPTAQRYIRRLKQKIAQGLAI